jgi:hypothetical protein
MSDRALDDLSRLIVTGGQALLGGLLAIVLGGIGGFAGVSIGLGPKRIAACILVGAALGLTLGTTRKKAAKGLPTVELLRRDPSQVAHAVAITKGAGAGGGSCYLALVRADGKLLLPAVRLKQGGAKRALELVQAAAPNAKLHHEQDMIGLSTINGMIAKALKR